MKRYLAIIFFIFLIKTSLAQSDFQQWTQISLSKKASEKISLSFTPIFRFSDNASSFNDVSMDWRINYKLSPSLSANYLFRHWVFANRKPVYFSWYELKHTFKKNKFKMTNLLRMHHGLDINDSDVPDFVRWRNHYFFNLNDRLSSFIGIDLWWRLNGFNKFQRSWTEIGLDYKIKKISLRLMYRRIDFFKNVPGTTANVLLTGLSYKL